MKKHPMRRVLLSTAATVSGVVLLLALKAPGLPGSSTQAGAPVGGLPAAPPASVPAASAPPAGGQGQSEQLGGGNPGGQQEPQQPAEPPQESGQPEAPEQPADPPEAAAPRTVTGDTAETDYGPVQVRITVAGSRITEASAVQAPSSAPRSKEITSSAVPQLNKAAVAAQSSAIDAVSGASYTSEGYISSLQSALDKAGV
ncbi:FMN-binding protein [Streptomyces sp. 8N616]|uniref:FMN-binding protein n=1 Tax=Streptomyces sp. 8N616 TaxID=3457414 RepID=UPI003FD6140F